MQAISLPHLSSLSLRSILRELQSQVMTHAEVVEADSFQSLLSRYKIALNALNRRRFECIWRFSYLV